jgi:hypothetical protein
MTQALTNFVTGVADENNKDARTALVGALGISDKWVKEYVAQLTASGSAVLAQLAALDPPTLDALIVALFDNAPLKQELLKLLNQAGPPDWLADIVKLLGRDGSFIDAYIKTLTTDAATSGTPDKLAEKLEGVASQDGDGHQKDLDTLIKALAARPHVGSELAQILGQTGGWVKTYLQTLAADDGTVSAAGKLLADNLDDTAHVLSVNALDALLGALAAKTTVQAEMVKVLSDKLPTDDSWLDTYAAALTGNDDGARKALAKHLGKVAHADPFGKLKSLVEALANDPDVLAGLGKTLADKDHATLLVNVIAAVIGTAPAANDLATFLNDRPNVRASVVNKATLDALLRVLEKPDAAVKTADFAKIIKTFAIAKQLRMELQIPEPPPSLLVPASQ